jgi:hypothetical protein
MEPGAATLAPLQEQSCACRLGLGSQLTDIWPSGIDSAPYFAALVASSCSTVASA